MEYISYSIEQLATASLVLVIMIYGMLFIIGAPFGGSPKLANRFIRWLMGLIFETITGICRSMYHWRRKRR